MNHDNYLIQGGIRMRKLCKKVCLVMTVCAMFAMPVSATSVNPVSSPELPDDDFLKDDESEQGTTEDGKEQLPGDEYKKENRSPKTGDRSLVLYGAAMAAIAMAGTIVIAKKKEA